MKKSLLGFLMILGVFVISCSDDDIKSSENEIKEFALEEQVGNAKISGNEITVTVSEDADLTSLAATTIKVSNFATVFPGVGVTQDFTSSVEYLVTAEDGSINIYVVSVALREIEDKDEEDGKTPSPQVLNSSFDNWYEGKSGTFTYPEIGEDEDDKTWGTGNAGAAFAINIGSDAGYPSEQFIEGDRTAIKLETQNMGSLAAGPLGGGKGIAAGNVFTGEFDLAQVTNAHPIFGYPFTDTPSSFKIDYKYFPEAQLFNGVLDEVDGEDALDMFVILERRETVKEGEEETQVVKRLGIGWYRSSEKQEEWTTLDIEIKYAQGEAPEGVEDYQTKVLKYGVDGDITITDPSEMGEATWGDITKEKPTHIVAVFTSSYQGDYFIGAPGSTLYVDNFELVY